MTNRDRAPGGAGRESGDGATVPAPRARGGVGPGGAGRESGDGATVPAPRARGGVGPGGAGRETGDGATVPAPRPAWEAIAALAVAQHGSFSLGQLLELGHTREAVRSFVHRGLLH